MGVPSIPLDLHQNLSHRGWRWNVTFLRVIPTTMGMTKLATGPLRHPEGQDQCQTELVEKSLSNGPNVLEESQSTGSNHLENMVIKAYKPYIHKLSYKPYIVLVQAPR